jgi:hypothetical protein
MEDNFKYRLESDLASILKLQEKDRRIVIETLEMLFPKEGPIPNLSIRHKDNFHRYFGNTLFEADLSEMEFQEILTSDISEKESRVKALIAKGKSSDLKIRVRTYEGYNSKAQFEDLIRTWVLLFNFAGDESNEIFLLRVNETKSKSLFEDNDEYKRFFNSLFETSEPIYFHQTIILRDILRHYIKEPDYKFIISQRDAQELALSRLKEHASRTNGMDEQTIRYYYNCYADIDESNRVILMPEASSVIFEKIIQNPTSYLKFIVRPLYAPHDGTSYTFEPFIRSYFGDWKRFEDFLSSVALQDSNANILIKYFEDYKKSGYERFVTDQPIKWLKFGDDGSFQFVDVAPEPPSPKQIEDLSLKVEDIFFNKIEEYNSFNFKRARNVKISDRFEIDIQLIAFNNSKFKDHLIEIKFLNNNLNMERIRESLRILRKAHGTYQQTTSRKAIGILILVYNSMGTKSDQLHRFEQAIEDLRGEITSDDFKIFLTNNIDLADFSVQKMVGE